MSRLLDSGRTLKDHGPSQRGDGCRSRHGARSSACCAGLRSVGFALETCGGSSRSAAFREAIAAFQLTLLYRRVPGCS